MLQNLIPWENSAEQKQYRGIKMAKKVKLDIGIEDVRQLNLVKCTQHLKHLYFQVSVLTWECIWNWIPKPKTGKRDA